MKKLALILLISFFACSKEDPVVSNGNEVNLSVTFDTDSLLNAKLLDKEHSLVSFAGDDVVVKSKIYPASGHYFPTVGHVEIVETPPYAELEQFINGNKGYMVNNLKI